MREKYENYGCCTIPQTQAECELQRAADMQAMANRTRLRFMSMGFELPMKEAESDTLTHAKVFTP